MKNKKIIDSFMEEKGIEKDFTKVSDNINYDNILNIKKAKRPKVLAYLILSISFVIVLSVVFTIVFWPRYNNIDKPINVEPDPIIDPINTPTVDPLEEKYVEANEYLTSHNIDTSDKSKSDIVEIYDDIISDNFASEKTYQLIIDKCQEIDPEFVCATSPEDLKYLFEYISSSNLVLDNLLVFNEKYISAKNYFDYYSIDLDGFTNEEVILIYNDIVNSNYELDQTIKLLSKVLNVDEEASLSGESNVEPIDVKVIVMAEWMKRTTDHSYFTRIIDDSKCEYEVVFTDGENEIFATKVKVHSLFLDVFDDYLVVYSLTNKNHFKEYENDNIPDLVVLDKTNGNILGSYTYCDKNNYNKVFDIVEENNNIVLFSLYNYRDIVRTELNANCEKVEEKSYHSSEKIELSKYASFGNGYIFVIGKSGGSSKSLLIIDNNLNECGNITVAEEGYKCQIHDVASEGNLYYLSTTRWKDLSEDGIYSPIDYRMFNDYFDGDPHTLEEQELEEVQKYMIDTISGFFTAVLIIVNVDTLEITEKLKFEKMEGWKFIEKDGKIAWCCGEIVHVKYVPYFNSHSFDLEYRDSFYTLDNGKIIDMGEIEETRIWMK